jgi:predicted ArsR family transcriptional regulator
MYDTRRSVLDAIRVQGQATVNSLADALGISPIAIRHHLTSLQAEGLVRVDLQRQSVGRPKHVYTLTEAANPSANKISHKYPVLVERLLDELKATLSHDQLESLIERIAQTVVARYETRFEFRGTLEERIRQLIIVLGEEGLRAAVRRIDGDTLLTEVNCPYVHIAPRHPEVCRIDTKVIEKVMNADVQQTSCVLNGDRTCTFSVHSNQ